MISSLFSHESSVSVISLWCDTTFYTYTKQQIKITVVCILIRVLDGGERIIGSELNDGKHSRKLMLSSFFVHVILVS
jgi:hypothetical protein